MIFLEANFFLIRSFCTNFFVIILRDIIVLENFLLPFSQSYSRITMCNLRWCYTFCTGVTLFALVLHLNCTALSQSESSNFFMCIIIIVIVIVIVIIINIIIITNNNNNYYYYYYYLFVAKKCFHKNERKRP